jgi:hypothetical protein
MKLNWVFTFAVSAILLVIAVGAMEAYCRIRAPIQWSMPDGELGWSPASDLSVNVNVGDLSGTSYRAAFRTNADGFREWGDVRSKKPKVLFVGDSFTGSPYTSNDESYFGLIKTALNIEVFAIGAGGYGTLQELILISRFMETIDPDLVVIQFCDNDFSNNSIEMEDAFIVRSQKNFRPYWVNGSMAYRSASLYRFLFKNSHLFRFVDNGIQNIQFRYYGSYAPRDDGELSIKKLDEAEEVTRAVLKEMARVVPNHTRLATFNCLTSNIDLTNRWIRAATQAGFMVWPGVSREIEQQERQGRVVRVADRIHWNRLGHFIAASELKKEVAPLWKMTSSRMPQVDMNDTAALPRPLQRPL